MLPKFLLTGGSIRDFPIVPELLPVANLFGYSIIKDPFGCAFRRVVARPNDLLS